MSVEFQSTPFTIKPLSYPPDWLVDRLIQVDCFIQLKTRKGGREEEEEEEDPHNANQPNGVLCFS